MLKTLHIKNLALVVDLEVDFTSGLTTVTGETGAGKSLILGAVQLLLGERAGAGVIRRGESQCDVSAIFSLSHLHPEVIGALLGMVEDAGVPQCEDEQLLVRRVVTHTGSRAYLNGSSVTAGLLREVGALLVDVHGPHEHQSLLRPRCQMDLLDEFADLTDLRRRCAEAYEQCAQRARALERACEESMSEQELALIRHQVQEIEAAELRPGEEEELAAQHRVAANAQQLIQVAGECCQGLTEADGCVVDQLGQIVRRIQELEQLDAERGTGFVTQVDQAVTTLQNLSAELLDYAESFDLDEDAYRRINERLDIINRLRRKYGPELSDVLQQLETMRGRLLDMENREDRIGELSAARDEARAEHRRLCEALSRGRQEAATQLAAAIVDKLHRLGFEKASFEIDVSAADPGPAGHDRVEFCFAPNVGEDMQPLRHIASSGEMSRVMLAIKTVLTQADRIPILIFDEVDANIGGRVAVTVAEELASIGERHQVLSITHLPQIAAAGRSHFQVSKHVEGERTTTTMCALRGDAREQEIIRMLGAPEDSAAAVRHAQEMLAAAGRVVGEDVAEGHEVSR